MPHVIYVRMVNHKLRVLDHHRHEEEKLKALKEALKAKVDNDKYFRKMVSSPFTLISFRETEIPSELLNAAEALFYKNCADAGLSKTETNVLDDYRKGQCRYGISLARCVVEETVKSQMRSIKKKTNSKSMKEAVEKMEGKWKPGSGQQLSLFAITPSVFLLNLSEGMNSAVFEDFLQVLC